MDLRHDHSGSAGYALMVVLVFTGVSLMLLSGVLRLESNQASRPYQGRAQPESMAAVEPRARFELTFPDYRSGASPSMLTGLRILEPMERIERSSVAYHATALPLSYIGWSQRG